MDRNAAITVARALIEEMSIQPVELFPEPEATAPATDIDALLPRRRWVPEMGEKYWWRDSLGAPCPDQWGDDGADLGRAALGNVFPAPEDAAEHAANIRAWVELRERSDKISGGWDIAVPGLRILPGVGFSSRELRDTAVAHIGKDRIDKLIRWIWGDE